MGCDIHLYFEKKNDDGIWEEIEIDERLIPDDRYYDVFGFLADVRNILEIKSGFARRGIPDDSSIKDKGWYGDFGFTHAYLDEIEIAPWKEAGLEECYFYIFCEHTLPRLCSVFGWLNNEEKRNVRVVMGFDN